MKKQLRKELKELAAKIMIASDDADLIDLKKETGKLFEKLSVITYLDQQGLEKAIPVFEESMDSKSFREQNWFKEPSPVPEPDNKEELIEPATEKIKDIVAQMPKEAQEVEDFLEEVFPKKDYNENDWDIITSHYKETPIFERKETSTPKQPETTETAMETEVQTETEKPKSINDSVNAGLSFGLNDRLAFIKHLFNGSADDYTRVLSQINTFQSLKEAESFISNQVKPDYNHWQDKEKVAQRFINLLEKRFN